MVTYHLAILKKQYLDLILSGKKVVESRFSKVGRPPYGKVKAGDIIFLKQSSGPVCAVAEVERFEGFSNLTAERLFEIKEKYNHLILGDDEHWEQAAQWCRFVTLIWLKPAKMIEPRRIDKQDMRGWVVLSEKENYGLVKNGKANI